MWVSNSCPLIPKTSSLATAPWKTFKSGIPFFQFIDNQYLHKFEHGQNCVKAIGTPFMSTNSVITR